ncbi:MAG: SRPBCC domain-containing protein [Streptosporangiaceae bacterium]
MKVTGDEVLGAPVEAVWAVLTDPDALAGALPGCERLRSAGAGSYQLTLSLGAAPVAGAYSGSATVTTGPEPLSRSVSVALAGERGMVAADLMVRVSAAGGAGTRIGYQAEVTAQGPIAAAGQRLLTALAQRLAADTLAALTVIIVGAEPMDLAGADAVPGEPRRGEETQPDRGERLRPSPRLTAVRERLRTGPSRGTWAGVRAGLLAGGAVGLAGIAVGALIGRRRAGAADRCR